MTVIELRNRRRTNQPFRTRGERSTECPRCEHYRRDIAALPGRRLASVGLIGCCIRPDGPCGEVTGK